MGRNERQHHHPQMNNKLSGYGELTLEDIRCLTNILSHAPQMRGSFSSAGYEHITRHLVSELPSHLRNKMSWVSPLCSLHNKMKASPVVSILDWIKDEIEIFLPKVWTTLQEQDVLNQGHLDMLHLLEDLRSLWHSSEEVQQKESGKHRMTRTHEYVSSKCAACILAHIGSNTKVLTALGSFFIGRLDPELWRQSKRIMWVESWIREAVEDDGEEEAVKSIWELGVQLRGLRKSNTGGGRSYIDEFVERAKAAERTLSEESPAYSSHQELDYDPFEDEPSFEAPRVGRWLAELTADDVFEGENKTATPEQDYDGDFEQSLAEGMSGPASAPRPQIASSNARPSSSNYSRKSGRGRSSSDDTLSELIDQYIHSTISYGSAQDATVSHEKPFASTPKPIRPPKDPELAKYPRSRLTPVTHSRRYI